MTTSADQGWGGFWKPVEISPDFMEHLRDVVGEPVLREETGAPYEWCRINLRTGQVRYPDRGGSRMG